MHSEMVGFPHSNAMSTESYEVVEPNAEAMIESLRAVGYTPQTSIADLVDNSVTAGATNVWLTFFWDGPSSYISVRDDGHGMTEEEISNAMRLGSRSPLDERQSRRRCAASGLFLPRYRAPSGSAQSSAALAR